GLTDAQRADLGCYRGRVFGEDHLAIDKHRVGQEAPVGWLGEPDGGAGVLDGGAPVLGAAEIPAGGNARAAKAVAGDVSVEGCELGPGDDVIELVVLGEDRADDCGLCVLLAFGLESGGADAVQLTLAINDGLAFPGRLPGCDDVSRAALL